MQHVPRDNASSSKMSLPPAQFDIVRDLLASYGGVYLDRTSQRILTMALSQRLTATGLTLEAYIARIVESQGREELHQLVEMVLNHETIFFRNLLHMNALQYVILPQLHRRKPMEAALRIWSAGCSTGEEPYSLAMIALETFGYPLPRPVDVWATDLSTTALAKARRGMYRGRALTNVKPDMYRTYFEYRQEGWALRDHVRSLVTFEQLNLLDPFPSRAQGVDIIFCQNVTIYFQLETFRNLVEQFYGVLAEGGMLFLGFSETLWNVFDKFRLREIAGAFIYVKETPATPVNVKPSPASTSGARPASPGGERTLLGNQAAFPIAGTAQKPEQLLPIHTQKMPARGQEQQPGTPDPNSDTAVLDDTILQRGRDLLAEGKMDEVLALCYQAPLNGAQAPQILTLIARAHANRGDFDLAAAEARRALELDSLIAEAYLLLGMLSVQQGELQEAAQHFERARYLEPGSAIISYHLAECYRQLRRRSLALREYRNALHKLAGHPPDDIVDGVAVNWLSETCKRYINALEQEHK